MIDLLLFEYGALMHDFEHCKCMFEKHKLVGKMNAINTLLDVPLIEYKSPLQKIVDKINNSI